MKIRTAVFRALTLALWLVTACQPQSGAAPSPPVAERGPSDKAAGGRTAGTGVAVFDVQGVALGDGIFVGKGTTYDNLTVFPILAKTQTDVGPLVSLHHALEEGDAEVRELDAAGASPVPNDDAPTNEQAPPEVQVQGRGGGAQVGTLAIDNRGDVPVYVLAGTIVKGGKQDRQVGQDFIIGSKSTVPIDAFCVEHGRWDENRGGTATGGKFTAVKQLANKDVRVAGQYKKDQSEVWSKVSAVNAANKKHSSSDSLLATADDAEIKKKRDALSARIARDLSAVEPNGAVVGYAYAIDGEVKAVRWFAHHRVFGLFQDVLVNTAVIDAITASAAAGQGAGKAATAESVAAFINEAKQAATASEVRATQGDNVNEYAESAEAYQSTTTVEFADDRAKGAAKKPKKKVKMSVDFVKK